MSLIGEPFATHAADATIVDEVTAHGLIAVHTCSRLGRVANPPSFSLADWFRTARRRRPNRVSAA
jgi:hypothetical protein